MDIRQSPYYAKYLSTQGWTVEKIDRVFYYLKKVPILGYILKIQRPRQIRYKDIKILSEQYRPWQISIEPEKTVDCSQLTVHGYKLSKSPFLPTKTLRIDLTKSVKQITADFDRRLMSKISRGSKVNTKIFTSYDEIKIFQKAWKNSVNSLRYVATVDQLNNIIKSFPQNDSLLLASHNINGRIIGGALFTISRERDDIVCYYWYGFTSKEGRALLSHFYLMYQAILWAKKRGSRTFDFDGIYDDRFPIKSWLGFSRFKREFGGYEVSYPGCYTKFCLNNIFLHFLSPTP